MRLRFRRKPKLTDYMARIDQDVIAVIIKTSSTPDRAAELIWDYITNSYEMRTRF